MRKIIAYKNAKLRHREGLYDIVTEGEKIIGIAKDSAGKYSDAEIVDLGGRLVCEPYVESHIHLDYVYTADIPAEETASGTLFEAIEKWSGSKHQLSKEDIKKRAYKGILTEMRNGVQYIRTHVDVTDPEFTAFQAMLEVKEEVKDKVDIQLIAFPQEGMYAYRDGDKLVEQALKMGADVVGGIPHYEFTREDGVKSVKKAIELACRYDKLVDIHCDETDDDQSRFVEMIAAEAYFSGLKDQVTASHTCAMGSYNNAYAFKLMSKLAQSGINCISDPWYPLGNGNLMNQLDFAIHISHLMSVEQIWNALDYITVNGAKTLHLSDYGIREGGSASFIVIDAPNEFEAVRERAGIIRSVRKGRTIFEKKPAVIMTDIF